MNLPQLPPVGGGDDISISSSLLAEFVSQLRQLNQRVATLELQNAELLRRGVGQSVGEERTELSSPEETKLRRSVALYGFEIGDRVFFSSSRENPRVWEALNWNLPRYYLHPDVVASLRASAPKAKVCLGKVIVVESVDHLHFNPLSFNCDYHLITVEIEQTRR